MKLYSFFPFRDTVYGKARQGTNKVSELEKELTANRFKKITVDELHGRYKWTKKGYPSVLVVSTYNPNSDTTVRYAYLEET